MVVSYTIYLNIQTVPVGGGFAGLEVPVFSVSSCFRERICHRIYISFDFHRNHHFYVVYTLDKLTGVPDPSFFVLFLFVALFLPVVGVTFLEFVWLPVGV